VVLTRALAAVAAVVVLAGTAPAHAQRSRGATILGRVDVRREPSAPARRPAVSALAMHAAHAAAADRRRSVVFLETAPQAAFEAPLPMHARLDQRDETFVPYVVAVTVGSTVEFPNNDRTYHNVFSLSKTKRFDLGRYPRGRSRSVQFDRPGEVRVFCEIHSHMSAWILVFAHRYFATTDAEGRYRIDGVPAGTYTVAAWNDGEVRARAIVSVGEGDEVQADLVVE
jgi:plastocyanin